jgi:hypothetical protein
MTNGQPNAIRVNRMRARRNTVGAAALLQPANLVPVITMNSEITTAKAPKSTVFEDNRKLRDRWHRRRTNGATSFAVFNSDRCLGKYHPKVSVCDGRKGDHYFYIYVCIVCYIPVMGSLD